MPMSPVTGPLSLHFFNTRHQRAGTLERLAALRLALSLAEKVLEGPAEADLALANDIEAAWKLLAELHSSLSTPEAAQTAGR